MTRSPRKSGRTSRKTAAAPQDEPPCRTGKGDEAVNEPHKALRSHFDNLRAQREKDAAGLPDGDGFGLRLEDLRWEDPEVEDVAAAGEEQSLAEKRLACLRQLINDERKAFERMIEAERSAFKDIMNRSAEDSTSDCMKADRERRKQDADRARDWLATSSRLLSTWRDEALLRGGSPGAPFPGEALKRVNSFLKNLSRGQLSHSIDAALSMPGRPERGTVERHDIAIAIFYIEATESGDEATEPADETTETLIEAVVAGIGAVAAGFGCTRIADNSPVKTVANAFGVDRKTIQRWRRDRDQICHGILRPPIPRLAGLLEEAGKRYRANRELQRARTKT